MSKFDYFVVFAEMRTGSNFLETNINAFDGLQCHGEAFNPHFIGYPNTDAVLGVTQEQRDKDPGELIDQIKAESGLNGFRFFNDHDPRILDVMLDDPRCAKIILTRNPVESYVSWKIAQATGQWKLTNVKFAKAEKVDFDPAEFEAHLSALQSFQVRLLNRLQHSGQTAFYVAYEDVQDVDVMNGVAAFLGVDHRLEALDSSLKKQNPSALSDKVANFDQMETALAKLDRFNLNRTPNFEPRRGAAVPGYVAARTDPLMYLPVRAGPEEAVKTWLAALDGSTSDALLSDFTQKGLRQWKQDNVGHRSFTVVRHPVARAHAAFCSKILSTGAGSFDGIRRILQNQFKLRLPDSYPSAAYSDEEHRAAFLGFLKFVKANLAGQTNVRVDAHWATQTQTIQGFAEFATPDIVVREDRMQDDFAIVAAQIGRAMMPAVPTQTDPHSDLLDQIYDAEVEDAVRDVYQRDYMTFGFGSYA